MPIVQVQVWQGFGEDRARRLIEGITGSFEQVGVPAGAVHVIITEVPRSHWGVGGQVSSDRARQGESDERPDRKGGYRSQRDERDAGDARDQRPPREDRSERPGGYPPQGEGIPAARSGATGAVRRLPAARRRAPAAIRWTPAAGSGAASAIRRLPATGRRSSAAVGRIPVARRSTRRPARARAAACASLAGSGPAPLLRFQPERAAGVNGETPATRFASGEPSAQGSPWREGWHVFAALERCVSQEAPHACLQQVRIEQRCPVAAGIKRSRLHSRVALAVERHTAC
jgi:4-oxalocrotonate tautomerase